MQLGSCCNENKSYICVNTDVVDSSWPNMTRGDCKLGGEARGEGDQREGERLQEGETTHAYLIYTLLQTGNVLERSLCC